MHLTICGQIRDKKKWIFYNIKYSYLREMIRLSTIQNIKYSYANNYSFLQNVKYEGDSGSN